MVHKTLIVIGIALSIATMVRAQELSAVQPDLVIISPIHMAKLKKKIEIAGEAAEKAEDVRKNARKKERDAERRLDDLEDLLKDIEKSNEAIAEAKENIRELEVALANGNSSNDLSTKDIIGLREDILDEKKDILKEQERLRDLADDLN